MASMNFFDPAGQQDLFSMFGIEDNSNKEETATAAVTEEDDADDSAASEDDDSSEAAAKKPAAPKKVSKPSAKKDLVGPVTVVGCGWSEQYGESGKKYSAREIARMAYEAGYFEVAAAGLKYKDNTLYVSTVSEKASDDALSCKGGVKVVLGQQVCSISAEQCNIPDDELALLDVGDKFVELMPEFTGCSLKLNSSAKVAVPIFDKKVEHKDLDGNKDYRVWSSDGVKELSGADIAAFYEGYQLYEGGTGVIFAMPAAPKSTKSPALSVTLKAEDLGLNEVKESKVKEVFTLPLKICLANYNQVFEVTSSDFGGKERVVREDVLNYLRPTYRAFRSSSRKFDFCYNKQSGELAVMIVSGEKGAASAASFFLPAKNGKQGVRIENTPVGLFKGRTEANGDVSSLEFKFAMEKIPEEVLSKVVAMFRQDLTKECVVQVLYNEAEGYYIREVRHDATKAYLTYEPVPSGDILVMTIHSHNTMRARFSCTDDQDEEYTGLFGVIGRLGRGSVPEMSFRAGMEGCFQNLSRSLLFAGGAA